MPAIIRHVPMLLVTFVMTAPLLWMLGASLKSEEESVSRPQAIFPTSPRFENYAEAVVSMPLASRLRNTLYLCLGSVLGTLISSAMAAYAFGVLQWRGRDAVFGLVIGAMLLPWQATMIPRFLLIRELGLYNSLNALVLPTFFGDAFYIFLLRQFFRSIPRELIDAARIDGCSRWGVFTRIVVPLSLPALTTVALFQFVAAWNDYGGPLLYLSDPQKFPLSYGLERFVSSHSSEPHLLMAAAVIFTAPILILFYFAQRTFLRGAISTEIKG